MLYPFLDRRHVPYDRCGKLVVGDQARRDPAPGGNPETGRDNDVEGMEELTKAQALALEPELNVAAALHSPTVGDLRKPQLLRRPAGRDRGSGGAVVLSTPFEGATPLEGGGFSVHAGGEEPTTLTCRYLVTAPGLSAQSVAATIEGFPKATIPPLHYGKGMYFRLTGKAPVLAADLPAADPRGAGHPLPPRPRRPGGVRPGPDLCRDPGLQR